MTRSSAIRRYVCILAVLALCAPMVAIAAPDVSLQLPTEFRALAAPPAIVLLTRAGGWQDYSRRPSPAFFLVPVALRRGAPDLVSLATAAKRCAPVGLFTAGPRTGRSPPAVS